MHNASASHLPLYRTIPEITVSPITSGGLRSIGAVAFLSFVVVTLGPLSLPAPAQTSSGQWVWISGSSSVPGSVPGAPLPGQPGIYGTQGVPAPANVPGGRGGAYTALDNIGNLWLFQGSGFDAAGNDGSLNDLWQFNLSTRQWTWISGSNIANQGLAAVYGTLGTPAPANNPGFRQGGAIWTDNNGKIWLFGGWILDANGFQQILNDLWKFDPSTTQWTWMGGSNTVPVPTYGPGGISGVYGTQGTPAAQNIPGSRENATSWVDSSGNLWLFGGMGFDSAGNNGLLNDLWRFNPPTGQWTWMAGSSTLQAPYNVFGVPGVYGVLGSFDPANHPGSRFGAAGWVDAAGNFWIYGGGGFDEAGIDGGLTDIWQYNPVIGQWAWMGGPDSLPVDPMGITTGYADGCQVPNFGPAGMPGESIPGCGWDQSWLGPEAQLWLFGGGGDGSNGDGLWTLYPQSLAWIWWGGNQSATWPGVYGALDVPAAANVPGNRSGSSGWTDKNGNFWLFGGVGQDSNNVQGYLNDTWEYLPPPSLITAISIPATASLTVGAGSYIPVTVTPSNLTNLTWTSSNPAVASTPSGIVNGSGLITGVSKGTAQITATAADGSGITSNLCTVTVGAGFGIAPSGSSGSSLTVQSGAAATYQLVLTPASGTDLAAPVTFSATGLPPGATASFTPSTVAAESGATDVALSIQTANTSALLRAAHSPRVLGVSLLLLPLAGLRSRKQLRRGLSTRARSALGLLLLTAATTAVLTLDQGCSHPNSSKTPPPVSYTITVQAATAAEQETTTLQLTVN